MLFIFDMGGVVTTTFCMDAIYKKLNISKNTFFDICRMNDKDIWNLLETGKISTPDFWNNFNERTSKLQRSLIDGAVKLGDNLILANSSSLEHIPFITNDLFRLFFHPQINNKTIELITALKKKHRVVCGTNTIQSHWENHLERGDYSYFDQTYASNKIGEVKPKPEFFKLILEAEDFKASETFFTDDKSENCQTAQSLGISTFLCKNPDDLYKEWIKYAD